MAAGDPLAAPGRVHGWLTDQVPGDWAVGYLLADDGPTRTVQPAQIVLDFEPARAASRPAPLPEESDGNRAVPGDGPVEFADRPCHDILASLHQAIARPRRSSAPGDAITAFVARFPGPRPPATDRPAVGPPCLT